jgi:PAS domain S-box-containing protein
VALTTAVLVLLGIGAAYLVARLGARFRNMALRLEEQEARFRQIADNLSAVVWLSDPDFRRHFYVNVAYERIWGRSREELERDPGAFMEGVHPDDRARLRTALGDIPDRLADLEFRVIRPNGETRWVWVRGFPVRDADGKLFRIAGIVEDITDRHAYAEERERLLENERSARSIAESRRSELERVTESRARLVRGFTHDVKNPLGAADGFLALLQEGVLGEVSDKQLGTIAKVRRAIGHALELIAHLLDIARAEAGQLEIRRRTTDVSQQVCELAEAFMAQAKAKELDVDLVLEPDLPSIETDPTRLRQVVGNLISNAVKYTPPGGHIDIRACHSGSGNTGRDREIVISVVDDGPGISAEKQSMLFTEFTRFDPDAAEGAGIGLAISQRIAQALGGEITVESDPGHGSTFALHLPA